MLAPQSAVEIQARTRPLKSQRIDFRVSEAQESLLRRGAQHRGLSMTDFIVEAACATAECELALQRDFRLPPDQWRAFLAAVDKPAESNPALHRLLTEPSVIKSQIVSRLIWATEASPAD